MHSRVTQYLNEIVSLTVMALLVVALAAGETSAGDESQDPSTGIVVAGNDFGFRHEGE